MSHFLRLENQRHPKAFVTLVFNSSGSEVSSVPEITNAHRAFDTHLFSCERIDIESQRDLFSYVSSRLSDSKQASGPNSLSVEFYAHFWHKLGETLVAVFNLGIVNGDLPESMKVSVTKYLKNLWPISLL